MITQITPIDELRQIWIEIFLNKTDKISDVSAESVLNAIAYADSKIAQKIMVNQAVIEGHIFPDTAAGEYLDALAQLRGVAPRFKAAPSTTYVRVIGDPGTFYEAGSVFASNTGLTFTSMEDVTIGAKDSSGQVVDNSRIAYIQVRCTKDGADTNISPLSITRVTPTPTGHQSCTNEYQATGGRDEEDDETFRIRIKESINQLATGTLSQLEQVLMKINPRVLRVLKGGLGVSDTTGSAAESRINLTVVSVNGQDFTQSEFDEMYSKAEEFLCLTDLLRVSISGARYPAINLRNVNWLYVNIDFRVDIDPAYNVDTVRTQIQLQLNKLFDYRFWNPGDKVEWDDMLYAVKNVEGVRYVPDTHFNPNYDINVPEYSLPRVRSFIMRDLDGNVIVDNNGVLSEVFYPNVEDSNYQATVLMTI
nr:MAG TPA: Baseplate wedge protein [Caudoviricetes sp.]